MGTSITFMHHGGLWKVDNRQVSFDSLAFVSFFEPTFQFFFMRNLVEFVFSSCALTMTSSCFAILSPFCRRQSSVSSSDHRGPFFGHRRYLCYKLCSSLFSTRLPWSALSGLDHRRYIGNLFPAHRRVSSSCDCEKSVVFSVPLIVHCGLLPLVVDTTDCPLR